MDGPIVQSALEKQNSYASVAYSAVCSQSQFGNEKQRQLHQICAKNMLQCTKTLDSENQSANSKLQGKLELDSDGLT